MTDRRVRIGVCGLGSIGLRHARLLSNRSDVELFVHDPAIHAGVLADLPDASVSAGFDELLSDAPEGVVIASPDEFHARQAIAACRAGVPVLVEKPVAGTVSDALLMEEIARATGVPVLVGQVLRHTAVLIRVSELITQRAIGTPVSFHATVSAYETLEVARSRFSEARTDRLPFDYVHEWDYLQLLFGDIERCVAVGHRTGDLALMQEPNVVDALVTTASGASGTVHLDYVIRMGERSVRVIGDQGVMVVDLRSGTIRVEPRAGTVEELDLSEDRDAAFVRQLDHFLAIIRRGEPVAVSVATALKAVRAAEAVITSYRSDSWVDLR